MARVLVVDDDASIRQLLTYALSMDGHTVETLSDGRDVVERLRAAPERVVTLMDVMMPHLTGLDVVRMLMEEPALLERHAIILMSAGFAPGSPKPGGVRDTLAKPFNLRRALELVERLGTETPATAVRQAEGEAPSGHIAPV